MSHWWDLRAGIVGRLISEKRMSSMINIISINVYITLKITSAKKVNSVLLWWQ
jgi:hypothetical protein